jgi:putative FmdB family regulatory protein
MPIYEFKCEPCDTVFEKLVFASDGDVSSCPQCGEEAEKLLSASHIRGNASGASSDACAPAAPGGFS